ncbi:TolC family outer membrane protein [Marinobacter sp.]|uniref:TolC family outer membrane protein n=1 Tax=Marinobacter sp. TaxID=50741 RepID=UPI00384F4B36
MKRTVLSGLIALFTAPSVVAIDLVDAYEKALSYDSSIAEARAAFDAQRASIDVSRSSLLPQINAFGDVGHERTETDLTTDSYTIQRYGVRLTQPVFRAELWFGLEASKFESESVRADYSLAQQQLVLDVATAYFNVLRAKDTLTTARATEAAIRRQYEQTQERYEVGLIAITEVYESRASFDDSTSQRIAAENDLDIARERLARLTGEYPENLDNLEQAFPLARPEPMDPSAWENIALQQNWQIRSAMYRVDASEATLDRAQAGHYPTLDLTASYTDVTIRGLERRGLAVNQTSGGSDSTDAAITLSLNVPLYLGGGTQAGVRRQRSLVDQAEQSLRTVRRDVRVNARSLFRTVGTNIESASALEQTIVSRRSALEATRAGYDVGTRNIVEVLDAERNYRIALRDFANARYDYVINTLSLKQAAGTLSPQDLLDLNEWLSASAPGIEALATEDETLGEPILN